MPRKKASKKKSVSKKVKKKTTTKPTPKNKLKKFEDCIDEIDIEIAKRRGKWSLTALAWMDFDDVSQILRIHIFKKWHMYDQSKKLGPWINRIISNQIKNLIRNNYGNYVRPCVKCAAAEGENLCRIYGKQDGSCPLYKNWETNKKSAYDTKLPVSLESHTQEVYSSAKYNSFDVENAAKKIHKIMKEILKKNEWQVYKCLYIEYLSEDETAKKVGYRTSEPNRSPGYKQIKNIKKTILKKVRSLLEGDEVDIY